MKLSGEAKKDIGGVAAGALFLGIIGVGSYDVISDNTAHCATTIEERDIGILPSDNNKDSPGPYGYNDGSACVTLYDIAAPDKIVGLIPAGPFYLGKGNSFDINCVDLTHNRVRIVDALGKASILNLGVGDDIFNFSEIVGWNGGENCDGTVSI